MFTLFHWARLIRKPALWSSSFPVTWLLVQCCFLVSWCGCPLPQGFALLWATSPPVSRVQQPVSLPRAERVSAQ